jgi:uncharacterized repeat protein (TIGR03803 family)
MLPAGGLVADKNDVLYGTTQLGGTSNAGTVYSLSAAVRGVRSAKILYAFTGGGDGGNPAAGLVVLTNGFLYGTTNKGGTVSDGTVFGLKPPATVTGHWTESVLHSFANGVDGAFPLAGLTPTVSGTFYGTTEQGGNGVGVVFAVK